MAFGEKDTSYDVNRASFAKFVVLVQDNLVLYLKAHQYCVLHPNDPWCGNCSAICKTIPLSYDAKTNQCSCPSLYVPECVKHRSPVPFKKVKCTPKEECQVYKVRHHQTCGVKEDFEPEVILMEGKPHEDN